MESAFRNGDQEIDRSATASAESPTQALNKIQDTLEIAFGRHYLRD